MPLYLTCPSLRNCLMHRRAFLLPLGAWSMNVSAGISVVLALAASGTEDQSVPTLGLTSLRCGISVGDVPPVWDGGGC